MFDFCYFREGLAHYSVRKGKRWSCSVIDRTGTVVVPPKYDAIGDFSEGRALFKIGDPERPRYGFIDRNGVEVIAATFVPVMRFLKAWQQ